MAGRRKLSPAHMARLTELLGTRSGLSPPAWVLEARTLARLEALGLEDGEAYLAALASPGGGRELDLLIESLRVGETRFFRHRAQVDALSDAVIPALAARPPGAAVRAWSAGCATGEEAYTLALLLSRGLPDRLVSVLGSDISEEALAVARAGVYPARALESVPQPLLRCGFEAEGADRYRVTDQVARVVTFEQRNLAERGYPRDFDLIWCRNVLIYFSPEARRRTVKRLAESLADGGFLFVGYSESLRSVEELEAVRTPGAVIYRKRRATGAAIARSPRRTAPPPRPPAKVDTDEEAVIELRGRYDDGERLSRELSRALAGPYRRVVVHIDGADYLDDGAAALLRRAQSAARAAGLGFTLVARRPGTRRWLERSGLAAGEPGESGVPRS